MGTSAGRWLALVGFCAALAGCGGGGGGGGEGGGPGPGPVTSGLVPAAPAVGSVLAADATAWRPLRPGAEWIYAGTQTDGAAPARAYIARTRHAAAATGVTETVDAADGEPPAVLGITAEAGQVRVSDPGFDGLLPAGQAFVWVELASPVRANEQRTLLDLGDIDLATDLDRDGRNDRSDVAAWITVIGFEELRIPAQATPLRTLRVDTTAAVRLRLTRDGVQPVQRLEISTWYAEGIGVVRVRERDVVTGSVRDHALQFWNGVTRGLGLFGPEPVTVNGLDPFFRGRLGAVRAALPVDGGAAALALTDAQDFDRRDQAQLVRLDPWGRLQSRVVLPISRGTPESEFNRPRLLADGTGALVLTGLGAAPPDASFFNSYARVIRVDGRGNPVGPDTGAVWEFANVRGGIETVVSDGSRIWFVFRREGSSVDLTDLVVHVRAPDGRELAPPATVLLDAPIQRLSAAASPGQGLVITTYERRAREHRQRVLRVSTPGAMPVQRVVAEESSVSAVLDGDPRVWPVAVGDRMALMWRGEILSRDRFSPSVFRGVWLDDSLAPVRSRTGSLDTELLPVETAYPADRPIVAADGTRGWFAGYTPALGVSPFTEEQNWLTAVELDGSALATRLGAATPLRLPSGRSGVLPQPFGQVTDVVPLANRRLLVIGRYIDDATVVAVLLP